MKINDYNPCERENKKIRISSHWVTNFNWGHYFWGLIWGQF